MNWKPTPELRWIVVDTGKKFLDNWGYFQPVTKTILQQKWVSDEAVPPEHRGVKITMKKYEWRDVETVKETK
jgi:hypothetical protein